jgi:hypothetical protein
MLPTESTAWARTVNGEPAVTGFVTVVFIAASGPITANAPLVPFTPPLVTVIVSLLSGMGMVALLVDTPLTKSAGVAGESWPDRSDHLPAPL